MKIPELTRKKEISMDNGFFIKWEQLKQREE